MANEPTKPRVRSRGLVAAAVIALLATACAVVAWQRFDGVLASVERREEGLPQATRLANRLVALRTEFGDSPAGKTPGRTDLIPYLESAAARAGIVKESVSINVEPPRAVAGRPDLQEQETAVDLKSVSPQALVLFLAAAEKDWPALTVREIVLSPTGKGDWTANVRLSVSLGEARKETPGKDNS